MDQFLGSGTTLIEAKLLGRNAIGVDINENALELTKASLDFPIDNIVRIHVRHGDARDLRFIKSNSINLVCMHPPYANIIQYSDNNPYDISRLPYDDFIAAMAAVARESYRVLRANGICSYMIGDIREKGFVKPLGIKTMQVFVNAGFSLKEIIIKEQHNCRSTNYWQSAHRSFLLLAHEYIFILQKDATNT